MTDTNNTPDASAEQHEPKTQARRGRAIRFAAAFLVITFALLAASRLAIGSLAMNWYLFQVARHTSAALALIGDSCDLESPKGYRGREAEVRGAIAQRGSGKKRDNREGATKPPPLPLTSWEVWQYRIGKLQDEIDAHREALTLLAPPASIDVMNRAEHIGVLRQRLELLEAFAPASGRREFVRMAKPGLVPFVNSSESALQELEDAPQVATEDFVQRMATLEGSIESWRTEQRAFVEGRLGNLETQLRKRGPRVDFCYRSASGDQQKTNAPNATDTREVRFSFEVVPDCGALPSMAIYLAAVLAFPAPWRRRLLGAALGVPILYAINVTRLACLAAIGAVDGGGEWFTFSHEYLWQGLYVVCVVATWLLWLELVVKRPSLRRGVRKGGSTP